MTKPPIPTAKCCAKHFPLDVTTHRLDAELELSVCNKCGTGRVQDLCAWTRLNDSMEKLDKSLEKMSASLKQLNDCIAKLAKLAKAAG